MNEEQRKKLIDKWSPMIKTINSKEEREILATLLEPQEKLNEKPIGRDLTKPWFTNCEPKDIGF